MYCTPGLCSSQGKFHTRHFITVAGIHNYHPTCIFPGQDTLRDQKHPDLSQRMAQVKKSSLNLRLMPERIETTLRPIPMLRLTPWGLTRPGRCPRIQDYIQTRPQQNQIQQTLLLPNRVARHRAACNGEVEYICSTNTKAHTIDITPGLSCVLAEDLEDHPVSTIIGQSQWGVCIRQAR